VTDSLTRSSRTDINIEAGAKVGSTAPCATNPQD